MMSNPVKEKLKAKPGLSEVSAICAFAGVGFYSGFGGSSWVLSFLSGALLGVLFLLVVAVIVTLINFMLLPRKSRAPLSECVVAPLTTLMIFLIKGSYPNSSKS